MAVVVHQASAILLLGMISPDSRSPKGPRATLTV